MTDDPIEMEIQAIAADWTEGMSDLDRLVLAEILRGLVERAAGSSLGRRGGSKGGHARAARLSPERRREIALKAARARWAKQAADLTVREEGNVK